MKKILFLIIIFISPSVGAEEGYPEFVSNFGGNYNGYPKLPQQYYNLVVQKCYKYFKNDVPQYPCLENTIAQMSVENTNYIHNLKSYTGDYGLAQINLYWNPQVSYNQAIDPDFAIDFLIYKMGTLGSQNRDFQTALCQYNTGKRYSYCTYSQKVLVRRKAIFGF